MAEENRFRPKQPRRAPDPSLEDMLRRAREARLGGASDTPPNNWTFTAFPRQLFLTGRRIWLGGWVRFWTGVMVGIVLCYAIITITQESATSSDVTSQTPSVAQATATTSPTATAMPTATATPVPTDTPLPPTPTPSPPPTTVASSDLATLVQTYYDSVGPFAGTYVLMDNPTVQTKYEDSAHMTLCVAYQYAIISAPRVAAGSDTRLFTLIATSDGNWLVVQMGVSGSCGLG